MPKIILLFGIWYVMGDWSGMAVISWKSVKYQLVRKKAKKVGIRLMEIPTGQGKSKNSWYQVVLISQLNRKKVRKVGIRLLGNTN